METHYLSNFYTQVGADTEFKKIIAATSVSLMFQIYSGGIEIYHDNGECHHREIRYDLCSQYIHGEYDKEVSLMLDLMSEVNYGGVTITCSKPELNVFGETTAKELEIKALEYLRDNKLPDEYLHPLKGTEITEELWFDTYDAAVKRRKEKD